MLNYIKSGGKSPARIATERVVNIFLNEMHKTNTILDVGAKNHSQRNLLDNSQYITCDIDSSLNVDVVCDIHNLPFSDNKFDLIICIEVLEHVEKPATAINELHRVLKENAIVVLSTRFIFPLHPDPKDYYRFTPDSLKQLFYKFKNIEIKPAGGLFVSLSMLILHSLPEFFQKYRLISWVGLLPTNSHTRFACGYVVKATK